MSGAKRARKREGRQARLAALEAARRKAARRRQIMVAVAVAVVGVIVIALLNRGGSDKKKVATSDTTSTPGATRATVPTTPPAASAAGKPCVAMSDPAPNGAPTVPVKVGPPPTDLVKEDLKVGTGPPVTRDETVTVNYIGVSCTTGKVFDSSYSTGKAASFPLSGVIKGWQDGIPGMNVGGQRLLGIPSALAYGAQGSPPTIGPDEPLWFVVDVTDAKPA